MGFTSFIEFGCQLELVFLQYDSEKSIDLIMFSNVDEKYLASFDNQLEHYPVTDVDGYRRQATEISLETVEPQGRMVGIQFK